MQKVNTKRLCLVLAVLSVSLLQTVVSSPTAITLPEKSMRINSNSYLTASLDDFPTAFHIIANLSSTSSSTSELCTFSPYYYEWLFPNQERVEVGIDDLVLNNSRLFLLNTQSLYMEVHEIVFDQSKVSTTKQKSINSSIANDESDRNMFLLVSSLTNIVLIVSKDFLVYYEYSAPANASETSSKFNQDNLLAVYKPVRSLINAYLYGEELFLCAAGEGLLIYNITALHKSNSSNQSNTLIIKIDTSVLQLPQNTSINIVDCAYDAEKQILYVLDDLNGLFVLNTSQQGYVLIQKLAAIGGLAIKFKRNVIILYIHEGKNRYLKEYFQESANGKIEDLYLNRRISIELDAEDDLWLDEDYAYLRFRGFIFLYRLGVPATTETETHPDDYSAISVPLLFKSMVDYTLNNNRWIITVGFGSLNFYKTRNYSPEMDCDGSEIATGTWIYDLKAYQAGCQQPQENLGAYSRLNSSYCIYSQKYTITMSDSNTGDQKKGLALGLAIGFSVAILLFFIMCYLIKVYKSRASLFESEMHKFDKLREDHKAPGDNGSDSDRSSQKGKKDDEGGQGADGHFSLNPAANKFSRDPHSHSIQNDHETVNFGGAEKKEALELGDIKPIDVDDIYGADDNTEKPPEEEQAGIDEVSKE